MNHWSKAKKIGWWVFVAWTLLGTIIMSWGMPLFATPSAAQLMLLLELVAFGFIAAFGISVVIEAWTQMVRGASKLESLDKRRWRIARRYEM